ncbi:peptidase [Salmonella enterica subsp. enterica]|nr:peptidase [Salmonella enterica subsp. enterica]
MDTVEETLPWLSSIGADPTGGMTRLLYSPEWLEHSSSLKSEWQKAVWRHALMTSEIYMAAFAAHNFRSR